MLWLIFWQKKFLFVYFVILDLNLTNYLYLNIFDQNYSLKIIIIILAQTPEIEQGLGSFRSCGALKPEQTQKDVLIIVDSDPPPFFMTYKHFHTVVSKLRKVIYRRTGVRTQANALPLIPQQDAVKRYFVLVYRPNPFVFSYYRALSQYSFISDLVSNVIPTDYCGRRTTTLFHDI